MESIIRLILQGMHYEPQETETVWPSKETKRKHSLYNAFIETIKQDDNLFRQYDQVENEMISIHAQEMDERFREGFLKGIRLALEIYRSELKNEK